MFLTFFDALQELLREFEIRRESDSSLPGPIFSKVEASTTEPNTNESETKRVQPVPLWASQLQREKLGSVSAPRGP